MASTADLLADAQTAYHKLVTGAAVASFKDSNGETVTYTQTSLAALSAYIKSLQDALGDPAICQNRPMRIFF